MSLPLRRHASVGRHDHARLHLQAAGAQFGRDGRVLSGHWFGARGATHREEPRSRASLAFTRAVEGERLATAPSPSTRRKLPRSFHISAR